MSLITETYLEGLDAYNMVSRRDRETYHHGMRENYIPIFKLLAYQLNLIHLDLYISRGFCILIQNEKSQHMLCTSHSMTLDSQVDCGTTD